MGKKEIKAVVILLIILIIAMLKHHTPLPSIMGHYIFEYLIVVVGYLGLSIYIWFQQRQRAEIKIRTQGNINIWAIIFSSIYIIFIFVGGIIDGFGKNVYRTDLIYILINITTIIFTGVMSLWIRHFIINSVKKKYRMLFIIAVIIICVISNYRFEQLFEFKDLEHFISFYASFVIPFIIMQIWLSYIIVKGGIVPAVMTYLICHVPFYILSVLPNLKWLTAIFIKSIIPLLSIWMMNEIIEKMTKRQKWRDRKKDNPLSFMIVCVFSVILIWFSVGVFPIYPRVVLTGSMIPALQPGDVAIIESKASDEVNVDDVLFFRTKGNKGIDVIHRVIDIDDGFITTKGDNNPAPDSELVSSGQVEGVMIGKVPYIGRLILLLKRGIR